MRAKRRKYTWFPVLPTLIGPETPAATWITFTDLVDPQNDGATVVAVPLLNDVTQQATSATDITLRDEVEGNEYVTERIVGRCWGTIEQSDISDNAWRSAIMSFGIAVIPVNDDMSQQDTPALVPDDYNPLGADTSDKRWMFRQVWTLWNNIQPQSGFLGPTNIANTGPDYGLIDCKSISRVRRNERLFMVFAMQFMEHIGSPTTLLNYSWGYDVRVLGAMRRAQRRTTL